MSDFDRLPYQGTDVNFCGVLMLKKSLYKLEIPAILCEIRPEQPYYLKIIYYNNHFINTFGLQDQDIVGENYDFLFDNIDAEYSENHIQYINLLKAVKNFKPIDVSIDIPKFNNKDVVENYKIGFHPNSFESEYRYCILTFEKDHKASITQITHRLEERESDYKILINNLERKLRNERVLRVISEIVASDIPLKSIADKISKILCDYLRVGRCILYDYNEGSTGFISEYHDKYNSSIIKLEGDQCSNIEEISSYINFHNHLFKDLNQTRNSNTTLICEDVKSDLRYKIISNICQKYDIASQICIVTTFDGKINGGLFLHQPIMSSWYVGEVEFLEIVAEQFSIAVDRSHSLDKVMDANQKLLEKTLELRKSLKEEKKMRKMQTEFVAMVSHEFKTPLQIIDGTREVIARKFKSVAPGDDSIYKFLSKIKSGVERLNGLIQSNLDLSKIEMDKDKMKINKEDFELDKLIKDILDKNSNLVTNKNIQISYDVSRLPPSYKGDKKLLDHCFTNIITNAIKYSNKDSVVTIIGGVDNNSIYLKVSDQGIGIPKDDLSNIGKKFFRAKNTLSVSGTGIGLYLTKYFIELHKGSVLIESEVDVGTTITALLPIGS